SRRVGSGLRAETYPAIAFVGEPYFRRQPAGSNHAFTGRQSARCSARQRLSDTGRSSGHGLAGLTPPHPTDARGRNRGIDARRLHPIATSPSGDSAVVCWNSSFEKCNKYQQIPLSPFSKAIRLILTPIRRRGYKRGYKIWR